MLKQIKKIMSNKKVELEIYKFNSSRKSIHGDYLDFVGFDLYDIPEDHTIYDYKVMDYEDYTSTIDANNSYSLREEDFNKNYPDGILVVILN